MACQHKLWTLCFALSCFLISPITQAAHTEPSFNWTQIEQQAKGQTVYFNAWGGSQQINDYLRWAAQQVKQQYGINLRHIKIADTAEITTRLLAEKSANVNDKGSIDLVWINGENFKSMKQHHEG